MSVNAVQPELVAVRAPGLNMHCLTRCFKLASVIRKLQTSNQFLVILREPVSPKPSTDKLNDGFCCKSAACLCLAEFPVLTTWGGHVILVIRIRSESMHLKGLQPGDACVVDS